MSDKPTYDVVDITPEMASEWLGTYNTHNRKLRYRVVNALADDILNGRWQETGDSIKRAVDGTILDGQHRLAAIVAAETAVRMLVVGNLPLAAQEVVDAGARRNFNDVLNLRGETHSGTVAAVTRRVWLWEAGSFGCQDRETPSIAQLSDALDRHPAVRVSAARAERLRRSVRIPASIVGLCHWLFDAIDATDCEDFFSRLESGLVPDQRHPIFVLRRTVNDYQSGKSRLTDPVLIAYMIKAWNAYRDGREIGLLRFRPGGANPETFPEPK